MTILVLIGMVFVIIWEMFHGKISLSCVSAAASEFCEWVQVGTDAYIPHRKNQVKSHSSPWFAAACANHYIIIEITFFVYNNRINLLNLNCTSDRLVIVAKGFLKLPNLHLIDMKYWWWCHDKNALWGRCFTSTSFAPHFFLLGWLNLTLTLLLDQLRLAQGDEHWW